MWWCCGQLPTLILGRDASRLIEGVRMTKLKIIGFESKAGDTIEESHVALLKDGRRIPISTERMFRIWEILCPDDAEQINGARIHRAVIGKRNTN